MNAETVFDLQSSAGPRLRGGLRALRLTDRASGQSMTVATVKQNAPGELVPSNQVVWRSAFAGLEVDVVVVWKRHRFSHSWC